MKPLGRDERRWRVRADRVGSSLQVGYDKNANTDDA